MPRQSRAVRLTLMLAARVEKSILAMRKGELGLVEALIARDAADPPATRAERLRAAVTPPPLEREAADREDAEMLRRRLNARLCERDDAGAFLSRPFHDCVKAICKDLGLDPGPILAMGGEASGLSPSGVRRSDLRVHAKSAKGALRARRRKEMALRAKRKKPSSRSSRLLSAFA